MTGRRPRSTGAVLRVLRSRRCRPVAVAVAIVAVGAALHIATAAAAPSWQAAPQDFSPREIRELEVLPRSYGMRIRALVLNAAQIERQFPSDPTKPHNVRAPGELQRHAVQVVVQRGSARSTTEETTTSSGVLSVRRPIPDGRGVVRVTVIAGGVRQSALYGLAAAGTAGNALCAAAHRSDKCQNGGGRQTEGGGEKVSHAGWPSITGVFWQVTGSAGRRFTGGPLNDELLGHHGSDRIAGGAGKDVLWGDWDPVGNGTRQRDVLSGGDGNDWIYTSHGYNTVRAGAGKDYVWAYYGRGSIDCGPGFDTLRIRLGAPYRRRNCERVKNFCAHGSKPGNKGGCYKPGEKPRKG